MFYTQCAISSACHACSRFSILAMLSPLVESNRARLATDPFGPRPKNPDRALKREEAPARARDLPADIDRGEMGWGWWSSEARQRRLLATRSAATCRNYGAVPAVHHIQTREPRHQVRHGAQTEAVGWHRGRRWFARVELAKPSKNLRGVWLGSQATPGAEVGLILMPITPAERRGHYLGADVALAPSHKGHLQSHVILQNPGVKSLPRISS